MLASKYGKFVRISKEPIEEATTWNKLLDIDNIVKHLFSCNVEEKRKPPYLSDFVDRVEKLKWKVT